MVVVEVVETRPEEHAAGYRECLDVVARERLYIGLLEAPPVEACRAFLRDCVERGYPHFVALAGLTVVGWCDCRRSSRWEGSGHVAAIGMGVHPDYRRRGIGRRLLTAALEAAPRRGYTRVELEVFASNAPAIALYEALGFEREGVRRRVRHLDGRYDDLVMMARLSQG